jgi:carbon monoxide dehydrogenase subunit G
MIETEQGVTVAAPIGTVWAHAEDMARWAEIMPGFQSFEIIDADHSRWRLKVGAGGLVRKVSVLVEVTRWAGPEAVDFTFALEGDPVKGEGTYRAAPLGASETSMVLQVRVNGQGPMAPMWEAMGSPLLPRFARSFAEELKRRIEAEAPEAPEMSAGPVAARKPSLLARLRAWLFGTKEEMVR